MQWLANRCQNGTHKPAISCAAQFEAKDLFQPDVLDVLGLLARRFVRRSWQHVRICRNPWAIEPRLVTKIWGCDSDVSLAHNAPCTICCVLFCIGFCFPFCFCFVLFFVSVFIFVCLCWFFWWGGVLVWFGLVLFVCLFVWLVGWLVVCLFVCLFVWLFGCVVVLVCVCCEAEGTLCAVPSEPKSIVLNFFVHATNTGS